MNWEAAMRWALIRARETGERRRVYAYFRWANDGQGLYRVWAYAVGKADPWAGCWGGCE